MFWTWDAVMGLLSNPPVSAGLATVKAIITEAPKHMVEKATLQMVLKSKIGGKRIQKIFEETFGNCTILARESGYRVLMAEKPDNTPANKSASQKG